MVIIAGVDEAGRGPLAGPVVAAAVILPNSYNLEGLDDSKKVTPKKRSQLFVEIQHQATAIGVGVVAAADIDKTNILKATQQAMKTKTRPGCNRWLCVANTDHTKQRGHKGRSNSRCY